MAGVTGNTVIMCSTRGWSLQSCFSQRRMESSDYQNIWRQKCQIFVKRNTTVLRIVKKLLQFEWRAMQRKSPNSSCSVFLSHQVEKKWCCCNKIDKSWYQVLSATWRWLCFGERNGQSKFCVQICQTPAGTTILVHLHLWVRWCSLVLWRSWHSALSPIVWSSLWLSLCDKDRDRIKRFIHISTHSLAAQVLYLSIPVKMEQVN